MPKVFQSGYEYDLGNLYFFNMELLENTTNLRHIPGKKAYLKLIYPD
ncbi:14067_t:CDS:2 [Cetraspora pellucida]|uniref:14067_t:CDS:1 n=1 Tax=Cetraspora pellucida TaxID=1433469 RepID=A0A9N8WHL2_9GLOM|nr:14067_t:CDS:2 [Cetraspora pellucida]